MFILIIFMSTIINSYLCIRISSSCGHPGVPPEGTVYQIDSDRIRFADGQAIRYICPQELHIYKQTRKCVAGRWVGPKGRCGLPIENDINSVQVFDCSDSSGNITNKELINLNLKQSKNPLSLTNSFHASRLESGPIEINGSNCYLWKLKLTKPTLISFMTIDLATRLTETDPISPSSSDILTVESSVSPQRVCRSLRKVDLISPDLLTNETFLLSGFYFSCDSISEEDYLIETKKMSQTVTLRTRTTSVRDIHLVAVFLAKHKINKKNNRPECGRPETVRTGVNHRMIYKSGISQFQIQCNDSFTDVTPNKPNHTKPDYWYSLNCSVNGQWEGVFPLCVPTVQCPGLDYLENRKDPSVIIESIENVYYTNETDWVAGEHSHVNFGCVDPEHIVVGKLVITCMRNGMWSHHMPKCTAYLTPESLSPVASSPWIVIAVLTIFLFLFLTLVLLIVRKYVQNMRKELIRYRNKHRMQTSIYTDVKSNSLNIYDDCDNTRVISRVNQNNKKGYQRCKYETEYIELEGTPQTTENSAEPLYIPILPPTP